MTALGATDDAYVLFASDDMNPGMARSEAAMMATQSAGPVEVWRLPAR